MMTAEERAEFIAETWESHNDPRGGLRLANQVADVIRAAETAARAQGIADAKAACIEMLERIGGYSVYSVINFIRDLDIK